MGVLSIFLNSHLSVLREARWTGLFLFFAPARSHALYYIIFQPSTPAYSKHMYLRITHQIILFKSVLAFFLNILVLLFSSSSKITAAIYRFPEAKFFTILLIAIWFLKYAPPLNSKGIFLLSTLSSTRRSKKIAAE